ncbi:MAG: outer membrane beta-barrel protein [Bacteroides sp.]|nr:outer membrane beta-barrel protein [Bacteroides sp.]
MRHFITLLLFITSGAAAVADSIPAFSYMPQISGTLRARWEDDLTDGESRFQVRNARLSIQGDVAPEISYFFQTDLCDRGKMKILDAYGQLGIIKGLNLRAGQFRMPMGVETFRHPANYIFANRSTVGKTCNYRAVGARLHYQLPKLPLMIEAGVFSPWAIGDHDKWSKAMTFGSKVQYYLGEWTFTTGFQSVKPAELRMNYFDLSVAWHSARWQVEAEYLSKHYLHSVLDHTDLWCVFGSYSMPVKAGIFNYLSFQGRWDGSTAGSDGTTADDTGLPAITDAARNRITAGATISYRRTRVWVDLRVNYEKVFYHHDFTPATGQGDRLLAEMVIHF